MQIVYDMLVVSYSPSEDHPPANEVSREVANLTERKNLHTSLYGNKEFVCLSVCGQL